jgi:hypothetical protein
MIRDLKKYDLAVQLRTDGWSIKSIARDLKISSSTASIWCRTVQLTVQLSEEQKNLLRVDSKNTSILLEYSAKRHQDKLIRQKDMLEKASSRITHLSFDEFFAAGLALYWAEGFKTISEGRLGFCNSDPVMIKFMIKWFKEVLNIPISDFILRVEINSEHINRLYEIQDYWSKVTNIPLIQFGKLYIKRTQTLQDYSKRSKYYGVLRIKVRKSLDKLITLLGWIRSLGMATLVNKQL